MYFFSELWEIGSSFVYSRLERRRQMKTVLVTSKPN